jgi:hypothetical protein
VTDPESRTRRSYDAVAERYAAELGGELTGKPIDRALREPTPDIEHPSRRAYLLARRTDALR